MRPLIQLLLLLCVLFAVTAPAASGKDALTHTFIYTHESSENGWRCSGGPWARHLVLHPRTKELFYTMLGGKHIVRVTADRRRSEVVAGVDPIGTFSSGPGDENLALQSQVRVSAEMVGDPQTGDLYFIQHEWRIMALSPRESGGYVAKSLAGTLSDDEQPPNAPPLQTTVRPTQLAVSPITNELHFAEGSGIRKLSADRSQLLPVAGNGGDFYNGDHVAGRTSIRPKEIVFDPRNGDLYFVDYSWSQFLVDLTPRIRRIRMSTGQVETIASDKMANAPVEMKLETGLVPRPAFRPKNLLFDNEGRLYFINGLGDSASRIVRLTKDLTEVEHVAGSGEQQPFAGDGPAATANIAPMDMRLDPSTNAIYFTGVEANNVDKIFRLSPDRSRVELLAGGKTRAIDSQDAPENYFDGLSTEQHLTPFAIQPDGLGALFFVDCPHFCRLRALYEPEHGEPAWLKQ